MLLGAGTLFDIYNYIISFNHTFDCYRITSVIFSPIFKITKFDFEHQGTNLTPQFFIILQHLYHLVPSISRKIDWLLRQIVASNLKQRFFTVSLVVAETSKIT
jgi:hypothetical protein